MIQFLLAATMAGVATILIMAYWDEIKSWAINVYNAIIIGMRIFLKGIIYLIRIGTKIYRVIEIFYKEHQYDKNIVIESRRVEENSIEDPEIREKLAKIRENQRLEIATMS